MRTDHNLRHRRLRRRRRRKLVKEYKTKTELQKAIDSGEIDVYFDYYNYNNDKYYATLSTFVEQYVVLGYQKDNHIVNSFESLKGQDIVMLKEDSLYNYFSTNSRANISGYDDIDKLLSKAGNKLIVLDREIYNNYQTTKFKKFNLLYMDTMLNDYKFMVKKNNEAFYDLFNYIINTNSYYNYRNNGLNSLNVSVWSESTFQELYVIILLVIFIPLTVLGILIVYFRKRNQVKAIKKEERKKCVKLVMWKCHKKHFYQY